MRLALFLSELARAELVHIQKLTDDQKLFDVSSNAFKLTWRRTADAAGLDDLHFHDLRHEAISRLFEKGLSMREIASISGHRDFRMLARYAHVSASI